MPTRTRLKEHTMVKRMFAITVTAAAVALFGGVVLAAANSVSTTPAPAFVTTADRGSARIDDHPGVSVPTTTGTSLSTVVSVPTSTPATIDDHGDDDATPPVTIDDHGDDDATTPVTIDDHGDDDATTPVTIDDHGGDLGGSSNRGSGGSGGSGSGGSDDGPNHD
jgi:hypothetical protein